MASAAPTPIHILRTHKAQINSVSFSEDNERLYSSDLEGWVTLTSTRTLRPLARWQAHSESVLKVQEWNNTIITHGRDHKLHVWSRSVDPIAVVESVNISEIVSAPPHLYSLDVNSLNFCAFSLLAGAESSTAKLALPNLIDSNYIDIWEFPSKDRFHAAIGKQNVQDAGIDRPDDLRLKLGAVMSVHILEAAPPHQTSIRLHALMGYEDGSVVFYSLEGDQSRKTVEGMGWTQLWRVHEHKESVMALALSPRAEFAISASADSKLVKYNLQSIDSTENTFVHVTKHPGNASIAVRADSRVCAIGGWDGNIRLYSTKKFKSLGTLEYHKDGCFAVTFARPITDEEAQGDEDYEPEELISRSLWMASGGKDSRVCIWPLISFEKKR